MDHSSERTPGSSSIQLPLLQICFRGIEFLTFSFKIQRAPLTRVILPTTPSCFGNSVTASTKLNSCLLVSLFYYCRCIYRTKCTNVFRTMIHMRNTDIYTTRLSGLAGPPGEGGEREKIFPNIYRSSQTLWCLVSQTPGVAPEQIGHCEHPQFLFRRQKVLRPFDTLSRHSEVIPSLWTSRNREVI